jgi:hypothetical protein
MNAPAAYRHRYIAAALIFLATALAGERVAAQSAFTEGVIVYKVRMEMPGQKDVTGTYTYTVKGGHMRKEMKLNNGYQDVVVVNSMTNTVYSLQSRNARKYAVQLSMEDIAHKQEPYTRFRVSNEAPGNKKIAGLAASRGDVAYTDGTHAETWYSKEWYLPDGTAYERFPDAKFLPLGFFYRDSATATMQFEAKKITHEPVEDAVFRIPPDYKIISYKEYKQMSN